MTDRINYLTVALSKNTRADDCQPIIDAISMICGVAAVEANVVDQDYRCAERRVKRAYQKALMDLIKNGPDSKHYDD